MQLSKNDIISLVFAEAIKSNVDKRKVGCVITNFAGEVVGKGHNIAVIGEPDYHAETEAMKSISFNVSKKTDGYTVYVSHTPCKDCALKIVEFFGANNVTIEVVEEFMKFDTDKLRYDLVPPSAIKGLAEVLTYGAKKYAPNNWKNCKELDRYVGAAMRHFEAYRAGEFFDPETGLPHLAHTMTNLSFLLELDSAGQTGPELARNE